VNHSCTRRAGARLRLCVGVCRASPERLAPTNREGPQQWHDYNHELAVYGLPCPHDKAGPRWPRMKSSQDIAHKSKPRMLQTAARETVEALTLRRTLGSSFLCADGEEDVGSSCWLATEERSSVTYRPADAILPKQERTRLSAAKQLKTYHRRPLCLQKHCEHCRSGRGPNCEGAQRLFLF
jgi:hypothetical protein